MKTRLLHAILLSALTFTLSGCDLELDSSDDTVDHPFTLIQSYNADTDLNQFQVLSGAIDVTYSTSPEDSHYSQSQIYQSNDNTALFHVYNNGDKQFFYIENNTLIHLDQVSSIQDSYMAEQTTYAITSINSEYNFVSFNDQGIQIIASDIEEREFVKQGDIYYFSQNDDEANTSKILSFNGNKLSYEKSISESTINSLNAFSDSLMYVLESTSKIQLDNLSTTIEIDMASAYPLASANGAYLVYNHNWGTPVYKIAAESNTPLEFNLHVPQPELKGTKTLFWAKTHFSNVENGSIYQFDGDNATPVLSEIDGSLLKYLSYNQVTIENTLYVLATTQNDERHILAIDSNDVISVTKSLSITGSADLINNEGTLNYRVREYLGNSLFEYNVYNLEKELVKTQYRYIETET